MKTNDTLPAAPGTHNTIACLTMPDGAAAIFNDIKPPGGLGAVFAFRNEDKSDEPLEILVYENIGKSDWTGDGMDAKAFLAKLDGVPKDRALNLRVNSRGGDVFEGLAIYNRLKEWAGELTATVDGVAASIASVICMAADAVKMPKASQMFIHDAWGLVVGNAQDMRETADQLDRTSDLLAGIYADKTGRSAQEMRGLMRESKLMSGEEARLLGFADEVTDANPIYNFSTEDIGRIKAMCRAGQHGGQPPKQKEPMKVDATSPAPVDNKATEPAKLEVADILELKNELAAVKAQAARERQNSIERGIDRAIAEDRIPGAERGKWVALALKDDGVLEMVASLPPKPTGAEPLRPITVESNASLDDMGKAFARFSEPMKAWQRGNSVSAKTLGAASMGRAQFYRQNKARLTEMFNVGSNTIPAGLQRNVILSEIVTDFARRLIPLRAFATTFATVPLEGTNKVEVRYYDLDAGASTSWVTATGYAAGDTTTAVKEIQIGNNGGNAALLCDRKYQGLSFTSEELARQPYFDVVTLARLKAEKLAYDIITHVLGVITAANYGAASLTVAAAAVSADDIADLKLACKTWPETGRSLWLDSAYDAALLKDTSIKTAMNYGGSEGVRDGKIPRLFGFDYFENPNIPTNSENLVGFAAFKSAIGFAQAPVPPAEAVRASGTTYEVFTDADSGVSLEYRAFADNTLDVEKHFIEASYGFAVLNGGALKRITSA